MGAQMIEKAVEKKKKKNKNKKKKNYKKKQTNKKTTGTVSLTIWLRLILLNLEQLCVSWEQYHKNQI